MPEVGSLLGCSLVALLMAGSGLGGRAVETTIQDDALLLHRPPAQVRGAARTMAELGADRVRITAGWSVLAPKPLSRRRPDFDAEDPRAYRFAPLDRAVDAVRDAGMKVQLDLAFWAPRWAVAKGMRQRTRQRFIPNALQFARFATAVARRYGSRVRMYTTWNEPNHESFLAPQWKRRRPYSPHVYRAMHEAAYDALKRVSPDNRVLIGGLSSRGSEEAGEGNVPPLEFLRTMACVDAYMQPLAVPECAGAGPLRADGLALHPYTLDSTPAAASPHPDDAALGDLARVTSLVANLHGAGRIDGEWPLYLTEYGYETRPPDPYAAHTPAEQARYLGWATFLVQRDPHTRMFAQFLLRDIDAAESGFPKRSRRHWRDWQTGLLFHDGRPKPAAQAFKIPLHVQYTVGADGQAALMVFGGARPGDGRKVVRLERQDATTGRWTPVRTTGPACDEQAGEFLTDGSGFFTRTAAWEGPGRYRLGWKHGGAYEYGAEIAVDADEPLVAPPAGP
jgi:Cellulase (glycosyl hydrolase family 5)